MALVAWGNAWQRCSSDYADEIAASVLQASTSTASPDGVGTSSSGASAVPFTFMTYNILADALVSRT